MLNIDIEEKGTLVITRITGELSTINAKEFDRSFEKYINSNFKIIALDLKKFPYIDSFGISRMIKLSRALKDNGIELILINMNEHVYQMFRMGTFDRIFTIMSDDEFNKKYLQAQDTTAVIDENPKSGPEQIDTQKNTKTVQYIYKDKAGTTILFDEENVQDQGNIPQNKDQQD